MKTLKDFGRGVVVEGFRLSDGTGFVPMFKWGGDSSDVQGYYDAFKLAAADAPYLRYDSEISDNVTLLCVTGAFFDRPDQEIWITAEDIKTLRDMPNRRNEEDAENFALAIEQFLLLQLVDDYASTKELRFLET